MCGKLQLGIFSSHLGKRNIFIHWEWGRFRMKTHTALPSNNNYIRISIKYHYKYVYYIPYRYNDVNLWCEQMSDRTTFSDKNTLLILSLWIPTSVFDYWHFIETHIRIFTCIGVNITEVCFLCWNTLFIKSIWIAANTEIVIHIFVFSFKLILENSPGLVLITLNWAVKQ